MRGRARVVPKPAPDPTGMIDAHPPADAERWRPPPGDRARQLKIGWELTGTGAIIAFVCWGVWAMDQPGRLTGPLVAFLLVLVVAAGVFALARLVGRLVLEERLNRPRRSAKAAHAVTGVFLTAAGLAYLQQVGWIMNIVGWLGDNAW